MNSKMYWVILSLVSIMTLVTCREDPSEVSMDDSLPRVRAIEIRTLDALLHHKDFVFINVHVPYDGEIPGTDFHIAYDQIIEEIEKYPIEKDQKIVVYCRSGNMSASAAEDLLAMGYTQIYDVPAGMKGWKAEGFELNYSVNP